jgi:hypothetical protein
MEQEEPASQISSPVSLGLAREGRPPRPGGGCHDQGVCLPELAPDGFADGMDEGRGRPLDLGATMMGILGQHGFPPSGRAPVRLLRPAVRSAGAMREPVEASVDGERCWRPIGDLSRPGIFADGELDDEAPQNGFKMGST